MRNFLPKSDIPHTRKRLKDANLSLYRIADIISEPRVTVAKIFNPEKYKYSEEKVNTILEKINSYLDELEGKKLTKGISDNPHNSELFIKLYRLGLDSKCFTPEEKLKLAIAHKELKEKHNG